ncbi:unnamed protein product, partial [Amoebophrya sp. A25]
GTTASSCLPVADLLRPIHKGDYESSHPNELPVLTSLRGFSPSKPRHLRSKQPVASGESYGSSSRKARHDTSIKTPSPRKKVTA